MALIQCPECGKEISDVAKACPNCGHPMQSAKIRDGKRKKGEYKKLAIVGGIIAVAVVVLLLLIPTIRMAMLSEEERCLFYAIEANRKDLLNRDSLQISKAYVRVYGDKEEASDTTESIGQVVLYYTAMNKAGGYSESNEIYGIYYQKGKGYYAQKMLYDALLEALGARDLDKNNTIKNGIRLSDEQINKVMNMF